MSMVMIQCIGYKGNGCTTMINNVNNNKRCGKCKVRTGAYRKKFRKNAITTYGVRCMNLNCELTKRGVPLTEKVLDVDHIKEVSSFPANATEKQINHISNAQLLCVYCHKIK